MVHYIFENSLLCGVTFFHIYCQQLMVTFLEGEGDDADDDGAEDFGSDDDCKMDPLFPFKRMDGRSGLVPSCFKAWMINPKASLLLSATQHGSPAAAAAPPLLLPLLLFFLDAKKRPPFFWMAMIMERTNSFFCLWFVPNDWKRGRFLITMRAKIRLPGCWWTVLAMLKALSTWTSEKFKALLIGEEAPLEEEMAMVIVVGLQWWWYFIEILIAVFGFCDYYW